MRKCGDCGAEPGQLHDRGCDVERCPRCGGQAIGCGCIYDVCFGPGRNLEEDYPDIYENGPTDDMIRRWDAEWGPRRMPWTGVWPGEEECREFGWFSLDRSIRWPVPCDPDTPGARPMLNDLACFSEWDARLRRNVIRDVDALPDRLKTRQVMATKA